VLAIIGKSWIDARDSAGRRRLDDPDDFVRIEITSALSQCKLVIPVLIGDTKMPRAADLPEPLRPLTRRNSVRLTHERFRADTQGLIKALARALDEVDIGRQAEVSRAQVEESRKRQEAESARAQEEERRATNEIKAREASLNGLKPSEFAATTGPTNIATPSSIRPEPILAALLLGTLAIPSAFLSTFSPWIFFEANVLSITTRPFPFSMQGHNAVPLLPATWFALVLCAGVFLWESKNAFKLILLFGAVLLGWIFAWESASAIVVLLSGFAISSMAVAGIVGGFVVSGVTTIGLWICCRDLRFVIPAIVIVLTGTIIGSSLVVATYHGLLPVYLLWEPAFAGVVAFFIVRPKSQPLNVISRKEAVGLAFGGVVILIGFGFIKESEASVWKLEEAEYENAKGDPARLKSYADDCQICNHKMEAVTDIIAPEDQTTAPSVPPPFQSPAASMQVPAAPAHPSFIGVTMPPEQERALKQKDTFTECDRCPEMIVVPAGTFVMGASPLELGGGGWPQHRVTFALQFAVGKFELTFQDWDACIVENGCRHRPDDHGWGRDRKPVIDVSWNDAAEYVAWLSKKTGAPYRLLSEAEREYVTRGGTTTPFWWGNSIDAGQANYNGNYWYGKVQKGVFREQTVPVDTFLPNPWGLYQVHGNVYEWTADCFNATYQSTPADGSASSSGDCRSRPIRGGSWANFPVDLRSASRAEADTQTRSNNLGFRVARALLAP
jgi:formylglycine-generating enzyme required for sulfatase activity